jgi:DNA-directed RNA polymerase subunit N (RpoN/RPB10)
MRVAKLSLRCPTCGKAGAENFEVDEDALRTYSVEVDESDPDGIRITLVDTQGMDSWRIHCLACGEMGDGEGFTRKFLHREDEDEVPDR